MEQAVVVDGTTVMEPDDVLAAAAARDPHAFATLYLRHRTSVYRYLRARVNDDDVAADLTATTFERALSAIGRYRPRGGGFVAWLLRIARNAAIDAGRRRSRDAAIVVEPPAGGGPERAVLVAEDRATLFRALGTLSDLQREAVILRYASRLTAAEIGAVIGKSEAATQKLLSRALTALKETYRDEE